MPALIYLHLIITLTVKLADGSEFNSNLGNILPEVKRIYVLAQVMHVDRHFQGDVVSLEVLAVQIPIGYPTVGDIVEGI